MHIRIALSSLLFACYVVVVLLFCTQYCCRRQQAQKLFTEPIFLLGPCYGTITVWVCKYYLIYTDNTLEKENAETTGKKNVLSVCYCHCNTEPMYKCQLPCTSSIQTLAGNGVQLSCTSHTQRRGQREGAMQVKVYQKYVEGLKASCLGADMGCATLLSFILLSLIVFFSVSREVRPPRPRCQGL